MTDIKFICPNCENEVKASSSISGKETNCPNCDCPIVVPYPEIAVGKVIGGFRVKKKIGAGGMGEVWLAEQLSMDRFVALKILSPTLVTDEEFVESFMHEIKIAAKLSHPNIITAHDAGEENGLYYLASTFVNGSELQDIIDTKRRLPERQALKIARAIARALQYAWDKYRIIHRDVKPGNIMIDRDNNVKLMDMGISKSVFEHEALTSGTAAGTPNYMSPEQARDLSGMDFRTDIYSLGITLFRCLTGRMPFTGKSTEEIVRKHIQEIPPTVNEITTDVSESTSKFVEKMLKKDRFQRHSSWQEVIDDIDSILRETSEQTQTQAISQERNVRLLTGIVGLLIIVTGFLYILHQNNISRQKEQEITALKQAEVELKKNPVTIEETIPIPKEKIVVVAPEPEKEDELLEEDRLLLDIDARVRGLKNRQQLSEIRHELETIRSFSTGAKNLLDIARIETELVRWEENSHKKEISNLLKSAKNLSEKQQFTKAANLLKNYSGDWEDETIKERLQMAVTYEEMQRNLDDKIAIDKKHKNQALTVRLAETILSHNLSEAEKICTVISKEDATSFTFDTEETINTIRQLRIINHLLSEFLKERIGKKIILEFVDGTKKKLTIEGIDADYFSASKSIGESSITIKLQLSNLSIGQRIRMFPEEISSECKALYQALDAIKEGNSKKTYKFINESGSISSLLREYLDVRLALTKLLEHINIKTTDLTEKTAAKIARLKIKGEKAATLFIELLDFRENNPLYHTHPIYKALLKCAELNFPLEHLFSGKVSEFTLQPLIATIEYDFSKPEQENDFEVYKPITMGQKVEIQNNSLAIGCRRHGSLVVMPIFNNLEAIFEGSFRLRDFNHLLVSKDKNIAFIAHGFGKYNSDEKNGVIRNWKLTETDQTKLDDSTLVAGISNHGVLKWDGEIVHFSINDKDWPKQVFMQEQAQFAIAAFGTTNTYTNITLKGQLSTTWMINRIREIFSEE